MLVLQLSDLHTEADGALAYAVADSAQDLRRAVAHIPFLRQKPDCVVITGDLASSGKHGAYDIVSDALCQLDMPIYVLPGNHDKRENLLQHLGNFCPAESAIAPWLCYSIEYNDARLVLLDTMKPGSHSGHLTPEVADWLGAKLAERPDCPTLLFTHHPPFLSGMSVMDEPFENVHLLEDILRKNSQIRLCCGHLHRAITTLWADRICLVAPSTSMQMELDLSPAGGDAFMMEAPGYLVHHIFDGQINSHVCQIPGQYPYSGPHPYAGVINPK